MSGFWVVESQDLLLVLIVKEERETKEDLHVVGMVVGQGEEQAWGHKAKAPALDRSAQPIVCRLTCQEDRWWSRLRLELDAERSHLLNMMHGWRKSQREETGSQTKPGMLPHSGATHTRGTQPGR